MSQPIAQMCAQCDAVIAKKCLNYMKFTIIIP